MSMYLKWIDEGEMNGKNHLKQRVHEPPLAVPCALYLDHIELRKENLKVRYLSQDFKPGTQYWDFLFYRRPFQGEIQDNSIQHTFSHPTHPHVSSKVEYSFTRQRTSHQACGPASEAFSLCCPSTWYCNAPAMSLCSSPGSGRKSHPMINPFLSAVVEVCRLRTRIAYS